MNIEEIKTKLGKKKKLAVGLNVVGAGLGAAAGAATGIIANNALTAAKIEQKQYFLNLFYTHIIDNYGPKYVDPYVSIEPNGFTYLDNLLLHQDKIPNFGYVYDLFSSSFQGQYKEIIDPDVILAQSTGIGIGAALVVWALIAAYPTVKYLLYKRKYNQLNQTQSVEKEM